MAIPQINEQYILDAIADRVFNGTYISTQKATAVSERTCPAVSWRSKSIFCKADEAEKYPMYKGRLRMQNDMIKKRIER